MEKIYTDEKLRIESLKPKKSTVEFLLSYSKALSVIKYKKLEFETLLN